MFSTSGPCPRCGGRGKIIKEPCDACRGSGTVRRQRKISVNIPAGIDDGQTISLRGQGNAGTNGGGRGDQYVTVTVQTPKNLTREQKELLRKFDESLAGSASGSGEEKRGGFFDKKRRKK